MTDDLLHYTELITMTSITYGTEWRTSVDQNYKVNKMHAHGLNSEKKTKGHNETMVLLPAAPLLMESHL